MRLQLQVLLQALNDVISYELSLPLAGVLSKKEAEEHYEDALEYVMKYPTLVRRLQQKDKAEWLKELKRVEKELS